MVRWQKANNVSTPPAELAQLAEDEDLWVRRAVAEDPATLTQVLEKLAADQDVNIPPPTRHRAETFWVVPGPGWWFLIMSAVAVGVTLGAVLVWAIVFGALGAALKLALWRPGTSWPISSTGCPGQPTPPFAARPMPPPGPWRSPPARTFRPPRGNGGTTCTTSQTNRMCKSATETTTVPAPTS